MSPGAVIDLWTRDELGDTGGATGARAGVGAEFGAASSGIAESGWDWRAIGSCGQRTPVEGWWARIRGEWAWLGAEIVAESGRARSQLHR